jgi:dCTP deaminase
LTRSFRPREEEFITQRPAGEVSEIGAGWLSGTEIYRQLAAGRIFIEPFNPTALNPNSYNYRLSSNLRRLTSDVIDLRGEDSFEDIEIEESGTILEPGELYLGCTEERFGSSFYASLITGRSSIGRKFITNHITAGLIDVGFFGKITLEIAVSRRTIVYPLIQFGQIFWFTVAGDPDQYNGKYQSQATPVPSQIFIETIGLGRKDTDAELR